MARRLREELKAKKQAYVQDEITAVAADLIATDGYRAVTIDDIAGELGYTKSVVYYYFKNKNEVLWTVFNQIHEAWSSDMDGIMKSDAAPDCKLRDMIRRHALNVLERTSWTAIYFREQGSLTAPQRKIVKERDRKFNDNFRMVYDAGVKVGLFKDIPMPLVIGGIIGMCNWTHDWYNPKGTLKADEIADHFADIFLAGCLRQS